MANTKAKITAISCKTDKYGIDTTDLTVEVENLNELNQVLKVLRRIEGVYEVRRKT
jgi:(p)ppGpp synthase/HD superfamily hydrolase